MRFVDTNILVYAHQPDAGSKYRVAAALLKDMWARHDGAVSAQVLQEFFVTVTQKLRTKLSVEQARRTVRDYLSWRVVPITGELVVEATAIQQQARLSYWDAAIVAAAVDAGAHELLTEDLNDGQTVRGVTFRNPFTPSQ